MFRLTPSEKKKIPETEMWDEHLPHLDVSYVNYAMVIIQIFHDKFSVLYSNDENKFI